jgi:hypothetical protein
MRYCLWIAFAAYGILLTSCNLQSNETTAASLASRTPIPDTPTSVFSTPTLVPIETLLARDTPTPVPTSTPGISLASPKGQPVNCRFGPDISYAVVGALNLGRQAEIIGRNSDSSWWYVRNPSDPSTVCWLSAEFVSMAGNVEGLPVVGPPEIGVTNVRVTVDPPAMNVVCGAFTQSFSVAAQITANGPAVVTWRWETSTGEAFNEETLLFEAAGTKTVQYYYLARSATDYWIRLHVLLPNDISGGANFKVTCTP